MILDITERKKADGELRKLSSAIEQSPNPVIITDTESRIEYVNPKFTEIFGYTKKETPDESTLFLKTSPRTEDGNIAISEWHDVTTYGLQERGTHNRVFTCTRSDGSERIVSFQAVALDQLYNRFETCLAKTFSRQLNLSRQYFVCQETTILLMDS